MDHYAQGHDLEAEHGFLHVASGALTVDLWAYRSPYDDDLGPVTMTPQQATALAWDLITAASVSKQIHWEQPYDRGPDACPECEGTGNIGEFVQGIGFVDSMCQACDGEGQKRGQEKEADPGAADAQGTDRAAVGGDRFAVAGGVSDPGPD